MCPAPCIRLIRFEVARCGYMPSMSVRLHLLSLEQVVTSFTARERERKRDRESMFVIQYACRCSYPGIQELV